MFLHHPVAARSDFNWVGIQINIFFVSSTLNDMLTHFEQLRYLDFYTLIKLSVILPQEVLHY
jgi:hypothetical protein